MPNREQAISDAKDAINAYETHTSPFADDWAGLAYQLKQALADLLEIVEHPVVPSPPAGSYADKILKAGY